MIGYQGVEAKFMVINGVKKRRLCGDVSKLARRIFLLLAFYSFFFFDACESKGGGHIIFTIMVYYDLVYCYLSI